MGRRTTGQATSMRRAPTPLGALARGLAAGVVGTVAMTGWQELASRLRSSNGSSSESSAPQSEREAWEQAPAPAQVGKRIVEGVFGASVSAERIGLLTTVMHWGYGAGWGGVYGLVQSTRGRRRLRDGLVFGTTVWAMSYAELVPMGIYDPPWTYPPQELALDLSYHLAYGAGLASAYRVLA